MFHFKETNQVVDFLMKKLGEGAKQYTVYSTPDADNTRVINTYVYPTSADPQSQQELEERSIFIKQDTKVVKDTLKLVSQDGWMSV